MAIDLNADAAAYMAVSPFRDSADIDGGPSTIDGHFVDAYRGDSEVESSRPTFLASSSDISSSSLTRSSTLTLNSVVYRCKEFKSANTGFTLITLERQ